MYHQRYHPVGHGTAPIDYCKYTGLSIMAQSELIMSVFVSSGLWPLLVLWSLDLRNHCSPPKLKCVRLCACMCPDWVAASNIKAWYSCQWHGRQQRCNLLNTTNTTLQENHNIHTYIPTCVKTCFRSSKYLAMKLRNTTEQVTLLSDSITETWSHHHHHTPPPRTSPLYTCSLFLYMPPLPQPISWSRTTSQTSQRVRAKDEWRRAFQWSQPTFRWD